MHLVESLDDVNAFASWLTKPHRLVGLDTETTGLSLVRDRLRLVQFGDAHEGWAIPTEDWRGLVRWALSVYDGPLVLQNAKFDANMLQAAGLPFRWNRVHDTRVMLSLHDSLGPQSLKPAAALHLGQWARMGQTELKQAMTKNRWTWETVPVTFPAYWAYACLDTIITVRLAEKLWPLIKPYRTPYDLEMACQRVLSEVELHGVRLDVEYVEHASDILRKSLDEQLHALEERGVNPNSPTQIVAALQADGVELTKRTENDAFSVDEDVLSRLDHPLAKMLLRYRHDKKILSSYFESFLEHQDDGWLHPSINQLQARTGRMSVTEPAMQTLPRDAYVRDAIIPDNEDHVLVLVDYDNQELRVAAHISNDENMIAAFLEGRDLHMETARYVYGPEATKEQRRRGKNGTFSKIYGAKIAKFATTIGASMDEAERVYNALNELYPGIERTMQQVIEVVVERAKEANSDNGWVRLLDGRHVSVPRFKAYAGLNYLVQGSCAAILKQSIVNLDAAGLGNMLRLPVHDELVFSIPRDEVDDAIVTIRDCMERRDLRVPLTVTPIVADRWGDPYRRAA